MFFWCLALLGPWHFNVAHFTAVHFSVLLPDTNWIFYRGAFKYWYFIAAPFAVHSNADILPTCAVYSTSLLQCGAPPSLLEDPTHAGTEVLSDEDPELSKIFFYVCSWSEHGYVLPSMFGTLCDTEIKANLKVNVLIRTYWLYIWLKASAVCIANNVVAVRCPVSYQ